eukprot:992187-Prymnesium_polylepis.1
MITCSRVRARESRDARARRRETRDARDARSVYIPRTPDAPRVAPAVPSRIHAHDFCPITSEMRYEIARSDFVKIIDG